ncbi:MAG TPA: hypothetical protein PLS03_04065 [Terrimicrobiaceae bacterium]|nr:hypothetical protein [Terrimicrobiaceae bacterium]
MTLAADRTRSAGRHRSEAFGLVEIAMCLGIVSFVLLALLGLLSVGIGAGKSSREDTFAAGLGVNILAELKTRDYASLPPSSVSYYSYDGVATNVPSGAYYQCTTETLTSALPQTNAQGFSKRVKIEIVWPLTAPAAQRQTNLFETHLAAY